MTAFADTHCTEYMHSVFNSGRRARDLSTIIYNCLSRLSSGRQRVT